MSVWINPYHPVETIADLPRFCGKCGRPMRKDDHRVGFDRITGREEVVVAVRCPKGTFDGGHEAFVVSPRPPAVAVPEHHPRPDLPPSVDSQVWTPIPREPSRPTRPDPGRHSS